MKKSLRLSQEFCYLGCVGNMLLAGGCCELAAVTCCKCAWASSANCPLLAYLNHNLLLVNRGGVYSTCVRSVMLHVAEMQAMTAASLNRLPHNDRAMICWICNVKARNEDSSYFLFLKLDIQSLDVVLRRSRMRWFGHIEHSLGQIAKVRTLNVVA